MLGCAALRDDMRRAETAFDEARYEQVDVWLTDLEPHVAEMDKPTRARFYFLRGTTAHRLGQAREARHYLALSREEATKDGLGLRTEWRITLDKLLAELEGDAPAPEAEAPPAAQL